MRFRTTLRRVALTLGLVLATAGVARNPGFQGADPHAMFIDGELWVFPTGGPAAAG